MRNQGGFPKRRGCKRGRPGFARTGSLTGAITGLWLLAGNAALAQVSPCTSAAGQLPSTTITSVTPAPSYGITDLSAGAAAVPSTSTRMGTGIRRAPPL